MTDEPIPTADDLRTAFETPEPLTLGLEEELMLLDPESLDLLPRAAEVVDAAGDERFKLEMPAAQLELTLAPARSVPEAIAALARGRRDLASAAAPVGRLAAAGVHPFAHPVGELNPGDRYALTEDEYGEIARRQLVCALQVHVAVGGADRSLAVYNGLRPWLPLVAALAANAPFHDGRDTGMASIRPKIGEQLPRQGIPPAIASWEAFAEALAWGAASGAVPDARPLVVGAAAAPGVRHARGARPRRAGDRRGRRRRRRARAHAHRLARAAPRRRRAARDRRHVAAGGEPLGRGAPRHGRGAGRPAHGRAHARARVPGGARRRAGAGRAASLGCADELATVERLAAHGGAARQREVAAAGGGVRAVAEWLADVYAPEPDYVAAPSGRPVAG